MWQVSFLLPFSKYLTRGIFELGQSNRQFDGQLVLILSRRSLKIIKYIHLFYDS